LIPFTQRKVAILEYHDLSSDRLHSRDFHSPYVLPANIFRGHMEWLQENGYNALTIDRLFEPSVPEKSVVLTFDDGHISNYEFAYPVLRKLKLAATFFIVPGYIGKTDRMSVAQMIEMKESGMRFESHSLTHPYLVDLTKQEMLREMTESKSRIEALVNNKVSHFSVPYGFYDGNVIECATEAGYRTLVTEEFGYCRLSSDPFKIVPRFTIKSGCGLDKLKCIMEKRKAPLAGDYANYLSLRLAKSLLGHKRYLRVKALVLK